MKPRETHALYLALIDWRLACERRGWILSGLDPLDPRMPHDSYDQAAERHALILGFETARHMYQVAPYLR